MFFEGLIDSQVQCYMFYMAPIQIARIYRLTQEITPAGTLISVNMVIGIFGGTTIHLLVDSLSDSIIDWEERLIALVMLLLAVVILAKQARDEWRQSRRRSSNSSSRID